MQRTRRTGNNELLGRMWKRCRLVGLINQIFCYLGIFNVLIILLAFVTNCHILADPLINGCKGVHQSGIFLLICIVLCIGIAWLIRVNNYLRSTNIPTDGNNVKVWLCYYTVFLLLSILCFIGILYSPLDDRVIENVGNGIAIIILVAELYVVRKFNKAFMNC